MTNPGELHRWIEGLPGEGRYVFSRAETGSATTASPRAVEMTLSRLKKRGAIASPRRGFFIVVPPEYRSAGSPPASWFIDDLMRHLGRRYYVALLTAASIHGAAHQQPMAFQVIADHVERDIAIGRSRIEFHVSSLVAEAATTAVQTETGTMVISTPETTALDLVRYPAASGYWNNVVTVLSELAKELDPSRLASVATRFPSATVQRLGWLLELVGQQALAEELRRALEDKRVVATPLSSWRDASDSPQDPRWRILVNDQVEIDL